MKIISVNVERNKHLEKVIPFLEGERADVVCLQEVMESAIPLFAQALRCHATFAPMVTLQGWESDAENCVQGVALLSKIPHSPQGIHYYEGTPNNGYVLKKGTPHEELHAIIPRVLLVCACKDSLGLEYTIATTHFTYTPDGEPDQWQEESLKNLLHFLTPYQNVTLTGDFNIPRPNRLYREVSTNFVDNIPSDIISTIDPELHRKKGLLRAVDYFWTRGSHKATEVIVKQGVSDHCALVGEVTLVEK